MSVAMADIGVPTPTEGYSFTEYTAGPGSYADAFSFSVSKNALFSFAGSVDDTVGTGNIAYLSNGASLTSVDLVDTTTDTSTAAKISHNTYFTAGTDPNTFTETKYLSGAWQYCSASSAQLSAGF